MSKVLLISGSPRKGNTEYVLTEVKKWLEQAGHKADLILLRKMKIKQCLGCSVCQQGLPCQIADDDMAEINKKLKESQYLIIGSPTYFDMVSALLKKWIDRTNPFYYSKELKGKIGSIIAIGAAGRQSIGRAAENIKHFFEIFKIKIGEIILFEAEYPDEVEKNLAYNRRIKQFAEKIIVGL